MCGIGQEVYTYTIDHQQQPASAFNEPVHASGLGDVVKDASNIMLRIFSVLTIVALVVAIIVLVVYSLACKKPPPRYTVRQQSNYFVSEPSESRIPLPVLRNEDISRNAWDRLSTSRSNSHSNV